MKSQYGFLLVTAIFLLVILAALGAFILTISGTQQTSSALDVQGSRAYQAARAGIDWASYQLLISTGGAGAVAFDAATSANSGSSSVTTLSWTHTIGASATNRVGLVGLFGDRFDASGVTWNGVAMTLVGGVANHLGFVSLWSIVNPPTGASTVKVTMTSATITVAGSISFTGANQTTPTGTFASFFNPGGTVTSTSLSVTSATGEMVFAMATLGTASSLTATGASQTNQWNVSPSNSEAGSTQPGAATVTASWTSTVSDNWGDVGVSVKAAPGSGAFITACTPGPTTQNVTGMGGTLSGFTAAVTCSSTTYTEGGATVTVYQITSTGSKGTVGTLDRVERQLQVTLTK